MLISVLLLIPSQKKFLAKQLALYIASVTGSYREYMKNVSFL
jgi:hypothetical protein